MPSTTENAAAPDYPEADELLREIDDDGVMLLTLNRPERNNSWTNEMEFAFFGSLITAANDPAVRAIVVTGSGQKAFCPGLDMEVLAKSAGGERVYPRRWPMTTALQIPKPVIGAINGAAAGIGFIQVSCCDVTFAAAGAKFTTAFARRGLPAENALSWLLPRKIGTSRAMDLLLSGRVILAEEAAELGVVNWVRPADEVLDAALAYARDLARNCSPNSMAYIKRQVLDDWERTAEESRFRALTLISETGQHPDFKEGVESYREKRAPEFLGHDAGLYLGKSING